MKDVFLNLEEEVITELISMKELKAALNVSSDYIYKKMQVKSKFYDPSFPRQAKIGLNGRRVLWNKAEIEEWIEQQFEKR